MQRDQAEGVDHAVRLIEKAGGFGPRHGADADVFILAVEAVDAAGAAGVDGNRIMDLLIWVIISALVGAKALLFIVDFNHFTSSWEDFTTLLRSGGVFYGGLIAAIVVCIWQLKKHRLPLWPSGDLFAPGIALGYMVGRLGCLMAGCCYGKPTTAAWGIIFSNPAAAANVGTPLGIPLHPTQLYEAGAELLILVLLVRPYGIFGRKDVA